MKKLRDWWQQHQDRVVENRGVLATGPGGSASLRRRCPSGSPHNLERSEIPLILVYILATLYCLGKFNFRNPTVEQKKIT